MAVTEPTTDADRRLLGALGALGLFIATASMAAILVGGAELRLAASGERRDVLAESLTGGERGWFAVFGCMRHDLAVGVEPSGVVYPLGSAPAHDSDRVFTPLAARGDCDPDRPPTRGFALVENDETIGGTLGHVYRARVAPPPIVAIVDGVIGFGLGERRLAGFARDHYRKEGLDLERAALLVKGRRPGARWVSAFTCAAGLHGLALLGLGGWWLARLRRRQRALLSGELVDDEEQFFRSETLE